MVTECTYPIFQQYDVYVGAQLMLTVVGPKGTSEKCKVLVEVDEGEGEREW